MLDNPPPHFPEEYWNWHANIDGGIRLYHQKLELANCYQDRKQRQLLGQLRKLTNTVNRNRRAKGLKPLSPQVLSALENFAKAPVYDSEIKSSRTSRNLSSFATTSAPASVVVR